jgi:recombination DNA repair RAD52 pathway protein
MSKRNKRKKKNLDYSLYNDYYEYDYGYSNNVLISKISSHEIYAIAEKIFGNKYYVTVNDLNSKK